MTFVVTVAYIIEIMSHLFLYNQLYAAFSLKPIFVIFAGTWIWIGMVIAVESNPDIYMYSHGCVRLKS